MSDLGVEQVDNNECRHSVTAMEEKALDHIVAYLHERSMLSFTGHKRTILRSRLGNRLAELGLQDFSAYWKHLQSSRKEDTRLFDLVTTNETSFFRNPAQFAFLHDRIIPGMEQRSLPDNRCIRVFCAGSSTGEEPYSIGMTLVDALKQPADWYLEIIAGDLSENCIKIARKGYYERERLDKLPAGYREKYTETSRDGAVIREEIRKLIRFRHLNLNDMMKAETAEYTFGMFDIIFCRNVMIYFSPACQQLLVESLHRLLRTGGYLFTGDAEPLHLFNHDFKQVEDAGCLIYQKTEINSNV